MTDPRDPAPPRLSSESPAPSGDADDFVSDTTVLDRTYDGVDLAGAELELIEIGEATLRTCRWSGSRWRRALLGDCLVEGSDLGNVAMTESAMQRVRFERSRLTGADVSGCTLQNVHFSGCAADLSNWRFGKLRRVVFDGCNLSGADFAGVSLSEVRFVDCDLSGAEFREVTVDRMVFRRCTLDRLGGMAALGGSVIDPLDPVLLGHQLAAALGITIAGPTAPEERDQSSPYGEQPAVREVAR